MKATILIAPMTLLFSYSVYADNSQSMFLEFDKNNDGVISLGEAKGIDQLNENWNIIDNNADKKITLNEFSAYKPAMSYSPMFDEIEPELGAAPTE